MEKKNSGLVVLIIILSLFVLGLGGYIVYDKVLNKSVDTEIKEDVNNVVEQNESVDYVKLENELKENFDVIYGVYSSPNTFCGNSKVSEKNSPNCGKYSESTQFKTYDELYNYLSGYATSDVLSRLNKISKDLYLEEDGKLYCSNLGKGGIYEYENTLIEYEKITYETINGIAYIILSTDMTDSGKTYQIEKYEVVFTKNSDKWIISKFELVK